MGMNDPCPRNIKVDGMVGGVFEAKVEILIDDCFQKSQKCFCFVVGTHGIEDAERLIVEQCVQQGRLILQAVCEDMPVDEV